MADDDKAKGKPSGKAPAGIHGWDIEKLKRENDEKKAKDKSKAEES